MSISEVMISFVRANALSTPGISAQIAAPAAPQTHISTIVSTFAWCGPSQKATPEPVIAPM